MTRNGRRSPETTELQPARQSPPLALICLTLFLLILPLTLTKPGLPAALKADEAAFYLASLSLWHDGDLVCDDRDARRLFREYAGTDNLLLMSKGPGQPVYFSVPIFYPLVATPLVALAGANGMVLLNAALLMAMVWMGAAYLRRHNREPLATLFAASFFLLSTGFVYLFWLQAVVFNMACVMGAFYLIESGFGASERPGRRLAARAAGSAALLAVASYSKPMLAALALPMLYLLIRARSRRGLVAFAASGLLAAVVLTGTAHALTEQPWPYFANRIGISLSSPVDFSERRIAPRFPHPDTTSPVGRIARSGEQLRVTMAPILLNATPEFLFGRHGGFFVYMPFAVVALLFFLLHERRCVFRWLILAAAVLTAVLFVAVIRGQWLGGGGFVGNRYFTAVYPSFLFLVRRIHPPGLIALGYAAAALFLGPLLITPLGAWINEPTLQAHVRNEPFPRLPMEWSLARKLPGYRQVSQAGVRFHGRRDELVARREEIWVHGAKRVEITALSVDPEQGFAFDVRNLAPGNTIEICLRQDCRRLTFGDVPAAGSRERVVLETQRGIRVPRAGRGAEVYRYRLTVASEWGEQPRWRGSGEERFYLGAALVFLGSPEDLARDLQSVEWLRVDAPATMAAGSTAAVPIAVRNASPHAWPSTGPTRVRISYHWLDANGDPVVWAGRRTELPGDVGAGRRIEAEVLVDAPESAGRLTLALDLVRERVGWFSKADEKQARRVMVEVVPGTGSAAP